MMRLMRVAGCRKAMLLLAIATSLASAANCYAQATPKKSSAAQKQSAAEFNGIAGRAEAAWKAKQFKEAAILYQKAVAIRPSWPEGWGYLASSLYELKRYQEARDAYRQTTVLTPDNAPSWAYLGLCEYELHKYQAAFEYLTKAEEIGLGDDQNMIGQVKFHRAILWDTAGKFELGLGEMLFFPHHNLGGPEIFEALGLSVLRVAEFPETVSDEKRQMLILAGQASFAANSQKMDLAAQIYKQLAEAYPEEPNVHFAYGQFLSHVDLDASLKEYEREIELHPSNVYARIEASYLYLKQGQLDKSLSNAQAAAKLQPQNAAPHNLIGRVLMEMDKVSEAIPELLLATQLAPTNTPFHMNLARAYQRTGQTEEASKEIAVFNELRKKQAERQPDSPPSEE